MLEVIPFVLTLAAFGGAYSILRALNEKARLKQKVIALVGSNDEPTIVVPFSAEVCQKKLLLAIRRVEQHQGWKISGDFTKGTIVAEMQFGGTSTKIDYYSGEIFTRRSKYRSATTPTMTMLRANFTVTPMLGESRIRWNFIPETKDLISQYPTTPDPQVDVISFITNCAILTEFALLSSDQQIAGESEKTTEDGGQN